jgi:hypothetical protein
MSGEQYSASASTTTKVNLQMPPLHVVSTVTTLNDDEGTMNDEKNDTASKPTY